MPYVQYEITVSAKTAHEEFGGESAAFKFFSPPASSDEMPPRPEVTRVEATSSNSIFITFQPGSPLDGPVEYRPQYECTDCYYLPKHQVQKKSANSFEISELLGGHFYNVWIEAIRSTEDGSGVAVASEKKVRWFVIEVTLLLYP